ncbi:OmpH family outer membrane protein [Roseicyclus persicicus]|uniref:OmpH family outer membrane protein n=1 Tax=Roseicyclus persicicus TaxID=2650661 RepID=A0A7X6H348_9RHOB|nr:OmpH family outer membrane protein [Roseibacterium persicicum]NKX46001.1 OmpH family outer membrane protein [Roseibacterium persicicum]
MGLSRLLRLAVLILAGSATAAPAQDIGQPPPPPSPTDLPVAATPPVAAIVVLNQERLLSQSLYGQRIQREVEAAGAALAAENRRIEAQLTEEELTLTERRGTMTAEAFRPLAEEFDTRVEGIRAAQEAKSRALQAQAEAAQARFFELAFPVLIEILRARGASVVLDNRMVLLSAEGTDITDLAIARVDAAIGEGGEAPLIDLDGTQTPQPRP